MAMAFHTKSFGRPRNHIQRTIFASLVALSISSLCCHGRPDVRKRSRMPQSKLVWGETKRNAGDVVAGDLRIVEKLMSKFISENGAGDVPRFLSGLDNHNSSVWKLDRMRDVEKVLSPLSGLLGETASMAKNETNGGSRYHNSTEERAMNWNKDSRGGMIDDALSHLREANCYKSKWITGESWMPSSADKFPSLGPGVRCRGPIFILVADAGQLVFPTGSTAVEYFPPMLKWTKIPAMCEIVFKSQNFVTERTCVLESSRMDTGSYTLSYGGGTV